MINFDTINSICLAQWDKLEYNENLKILENTPDFAKK